MTRLAVPPVAGGGHALVRDRGRAADRAVRPGAGRRRAGSDIRDIALRAEAIGFDTLWTRRAPVAPRRTARQGFWDGVSMAGAVAATTSRIKVGTWVLSALHRNPGIIAKTAETLDEISGGRFVFGLGRRACVARAGPRVRAARRTTSSTASRRRSRSSSPPPRGPRRLRGHVARGARPAPAARGAAPGRIPILIGGNGPEGLSATPAIHADIWSGYAGGAQRPRRVGPRLAALEAVCHEVGRDPATIGARPASTSTPARARRATRRCPSRGSAEEIADAFRAFRDGRLHAAWRSCSARAPWPRSRRWPRCWSSCTPISA